MGSYCKCGTLHEEDDGRGCAKCQAEKETQQRTETNARVLFIARPIDVSLLEQKLAEAEARMEKCNQHDYMQLVNRCQELGKQLGIEKTNYELQLSAANAKIEACKTAGFIDDKGDVRTVLGGKLPILASGEIAINGCVVYANDPVLGVVECDVDITGDRFTAGWMKPGRFQNEWTEYDLADCYSTREAATRAKEGA